MLWDCLIRSVFRSINQDLKIDRLEIVNDDFTEFVPRKVFNQALTPASPELKRSPRGGIYQIGTSGQADERISLPKSDINDMGLPKHVMTFLEVLTPQ